MKRRWGRMSVSLISLCCVAGIFLLFSTAAVAEQAPIVPRHSFSISAGGSYFDYNEDSLDVEVDGYFAGVAAGYAFNDEKSHVMMAVDTELNRGRTDYDGSYWDGTPVKEDSDDWIWELRYRVGYDFMPNERMMLTPYLGLGYRRWENEVEGSGGYRRRVEYWYMPLGLQVTTPMGPAWRFSVLAEVDALLSGKVESKLSEVDAGYPDTTNNTDFGEGYGLRLAMQFTGGHFLIEPYYIYWDIDESDEDELTYYGEQTGYIVYEPANTTQTVGLRLGYLF